ncbi:MAG: hypothetical protein GW859_07005, partial [Sphingomonadales bacterium]|nr:hypothetical protein [Sphingomonadales bacterium]
MAARPSQFPAFLQLNYEENGVFSRFQSDVANATSAAQGKFDSTFNEINSTLNRALTMPRNAFGALDLGASSLRQAAAASQERARAATEMAGAMATAAREEGDYSRQARLSVAAAEALAREERDAAAAALAHADAVEQVQGRLNRAARSSTALTVSTQRSSLAMQTGTASVGAQRFAYQQLGQQLNDVTIQAQQGVNPFVILTQQGSQAAFAMSYFGGKAGAVGRFLAGPWGAAVFIAVAALGSLTKGMFDNADAAKMAETGASGLSQAQSVLGDIFDLTSGKLQHQNELLILNARLTAINLRAEAAASQASSIKTLGQVGDRQTSGGTRARAIAGSILPDGIGNLVAGDYYGARANAQALTDLENRRRTGKITPSQALQASEDLDFTGLKISAGEYQQALIDRVSSGIKTQTADAIDKSLDDGTLAKELRRVGRPHKPKKARDTSGQEAREQERIGDLARKSADEIARVNEQFDRQPTLVDKSAQAVRKLEGVIAELSKPKNAKLPGVAKLIDEARDVQAKARNAINNEIDKTIERDEQELELLSLQAAGLRDVAEIRKRIRAEDERLGLSAKLKDLADEKRAAEGILADTSATADEHARAAGIIAGMPQQIAEIGDQQDRVANAAERQYFAALKYSVEIERANALMNAQLGVVSSVRSEIESFLGGQSSGKNFLSTITDQFAQLRGKNLFDALFGDAFASLEEQLRRDSPLGKANERLRDGVDVAGSEARRLGKELREVTDGIAAARLTGTAGLTGESAPSAANDGETIVVVGQRPIDLAKASVTDLADAMGIAISQPLTTALDQVFGTKFFQQFSREFGGAIAGYAQGGIPGALAGVLKEVGAKTLNANLWGNANKALKGSATGTTTAGIMKALGIKTSTTGAQLGGAIGSFLPIPGGNIIGAIAGGLFGGLFKKSPRGAAVITSATQSSISGNKGDVRDALSGTAGSVQDGLRRIADALGAELGSFSVSIGKYKDWFRVSASGSRSVGDKKFPKRAGSDLIYDGQDEAEAIKAAIINAISDGAIKGLREGTQRLLRAGKDVEAQISKALSFESVFTRLKAYKDPVGAALDTLDKEFKRLQDIFKEAGASAEEYAQLEELYGIERAKAIKEAGESV